METKELKTILFTALAAMFFTVSSAWASSHDVAWTFGNVGFLSYRLDSFEPADTDLGADIGTEDPTLMLQLGQRYQVTITNFNVHPFEVLAKGPLANSDIVLLSTGSPVGSFESDPEVAWEDNGRGTVAFTLTYALYSAMSVEGRNPGYRCRPHSTTMRGNFIVEGLPIGPRIEKGTISIELEEVALGLPSPVHLTSAPDETGRLFVVDQAGKIYIILNGQLQTMPFLDVTARLVSPLGIIGSHDENDFDERGFLGLAFHPDFSDSHSAGYQKVYTYTSEPLAQPADFTTDPAPADVNHQSVIAEWMIDVNDPNLVDPNSRREIFRVDQPQFNHDGGALAFGPDGYLYIALGDGGAGNDVGDGHGTGNGQNINTIHGSIVRIDPLEPALTPDSNDLVSANGNYRIPFDNPFVDADGVDEIYAYGLRNPFRFSFDTETGELIAADVGQNNVEEIDVIVLGGNYGWNLKEGSFGFDPETGGVSLTDPDPELIDPVAEYDHDDGISIIGGYIYRGQTLPELYGKYVFGDFSTGFGSPAGRLLYADLETGLIEELIIGEDDRALNLYIKGFGIDQAGEVYLLASSNLGPYGTGGVILKVVGLVQGKPDQM